MRKHIMYTSLTAMFLLSAVLWAQQESQQQNQQGRQRQRQMQQQDRQQQDMRQQQDRQQQGMRQQRNQQGAARRQGTTPMRAELEGWVRIGYDYDQDDRVDAYEYIYAIDLQSARQKSEERARQQNMTSQQAGQQYESQRRARQMSGTIKETKSVTLAQENKEHLLAKVQTQDNRPVIVDLGRKDKLASLDLSDGDSIQFTAKPASLNQRQIYMATKIQSQGRSIDVHTPRGEKQTRLSGKIVETATKPLEGRMGGDHVIALVKLDSGQKVPIDFGRKQDLQQVDISQGKQVVVLAEPVRVGNRKLLAASSVSIDGRQVDVNWLKGIQQQQQQRQQQQERQQQQQGFSMAD